MGYNILNIVICMTTKSNKEYNHINELIRFINEDKIKIVDFDLSRGVNGNVSNKFETTNSREQAQGHIMDRPRSQIHRHNGNSSTLVRV